MKRFRRFRVILFHRNKLVNAEIALLGVLCSVLYGVSRQITRQSVLHRHVWRIDTTRYLPIAAGLLLRHVVTRALLVAFGLESREKLFGRSTDRSIGSTIILIEIIFVFFLIVISYIIFSQILFLLIRYAWLIISFVEIFTSGESDA